MAMNAVGGVCQGMFYPGIRCKSAAHVSTSADKEVLATGDVVEISPQAQKSLTFDKALKRSEDLMRARGLDEQEITSFRDLLERYDSSRMDAETFLKSLSSEERDLVKRANSYGSDLTDEVIDRFSKEGAGNMLREQDYRFAIDLNGDDIVEHGAGRTFVFPPPSAPETVMDAWDAYSQTLTGEEKLLFSGLFLPISIPAYPDATTIQGYNLNQQGFPQSAQGWLDLLDKIYDTLEYNNKTSNDKQTIEHNDKAMRELREFGAFIAQAGKGRSILSDNSDSIAGS